jgi:microsomal dipeptidase-like Zn-dependent dipeptidase
MILYSNVTQSQTTFLFADAHYSGFSSELIRNEFSEFPTNSITELKEFYNTGGRLLGITFTIPDHYSENKTSKNDSYLVQMYEIYIKMIEENNDFLCLLNPEAVLDSQKLNLFITIEGISQPTLNQLLYLDSLKNIRIVGLIHNSNNEFGSSSSTSQNQQDLGLTEIGQSTIARLISQNIIIDISHFSERSCSDAIEVCEKLNGKIVASHSGINSLKTHPRNLKDEQLESINRIDGGIGLIIHSPFISENSKNTSRIEDYFEMLRYLQNDLNMQNIFIGSDYCKEIQSLAGITSLADLPKKILLYYDNDLSDRNIQNFTFNNLLKILKN